MKTLNNWYEIKRNHFCISVTENEWFILNVQRGGFYRVNYDNNTWHLLLDQLLQNHSVIHHLNRAQILDDAFNLAKIGLHF